MPLISACSCSCYRYQATEPPALQRSTLPASDHESRASLLNISFALGLGRLDALHRSIEKLNAILSRVHEDTTSMACNTYALCAVEHPWGGDCVPANEAL